MDFECTECGSEYRFQAPVCDSCGYDTVEQVRYTPDNTPGEDEFEFIPEYDGDSDIYRDDMVEAMDFDYHGPDED